MRILLVEDDQPTAKTIERMLDAKGHDYITTWSGEDAVARATSGSYDLILLDIMLPDIDGYEVLRHLEQADVHIPVVIQTGLIGRDEAEKAASLGSEHYLLKPFTLEDLSASIDAACAQNAAVPAGSRHGPVDLAQRKSQKTTGASRRRHPRKRTLMSAQIISDDDHCLAECLVINVSKGGAALQLSDYYAFPPTLVLRMSRGPAYLSEVCWQRGNKLGVRFIKD